MFHQRINAKSSLFNRNHQICGENVPRMTSPELVSRLGLIPILLAAAGEAHRPVVRRHVIQRYPDRHEVLRGGGRSFERRLHHILVPAGALRPRRLDQQCIEIQPHPWLHAALSLEELASDLGKRTIVQ